MPQMLSGDEPEALQAHFYQQEVNDAAGGLPINLDSLRDGPPGSKPFYPYSTLIRYAIKGSPNQKLLLEDIYYAIESRFPYFKGAPSGWKNSVRHNLSLNPCFEKVPRPLTDRGKGSYWAVNDKVDPRTGVHRIRKKRPRSKKGSDGDIEDDRMSPRPTFSNESGPSVPDGTYTTHPQPSPEELAQSFQNGPPPQFDPMAYPLLPRFNPFPIHIAPEEGLDVDEHGNLDWRLAWLKELGHLQSLTAEQEKAGAGEDWYRMMIFRVRTAMMAPLDPSAMLIAAHPGPPPDAPENTLAGPPDQSISTQPVATPQQ